VVNTSLIDTATRIFSLSVAVITLVFLFNNVLNFWYDWPGALNYLSHYLSHNIPLPSESLTLGLLQILTYLGSIVSVIVFVLMTPGRSMNADADTLSAFSAYYIRACFFAVVIVGLVDAGLSFIRVEGLMEALLGKELTTAMGRSTYRGAYVHYPLIALSFIVALFIRRFDFFWLALLVVLAEFIIVVTRFLYSYEQAYMGDLVRFWYAALFLFASAYTLVHEGHVRVDVLYTHFTQRAKAKVNLLGSLLLGIPLCWIIITQGMWSKTSSINSPLVNYEISQSGYGMYVKYLMAAFLIVFAVSMMMQFCSYVLHSMAILRGQQVSDDDRSNA
jgi:TRAP-type mannitol/chloroaromatic compound transport system permease small subunit